MTEQEKLAKLIREVIEGLFVGFGLGVLVAIMIIVWAVLA